MGIEEISEKITLSKPVTAHVSGTDIPAFFRVFIAPSAIISLGHTKTSGTVICGFEYTYDANGRISTEKDLVKKQRDMLHL